MRDESWMEDGEPDWAIDQDDQAPDEYDRDLLDDGDAPAGGTTGGTTGHHGPNHPGNPGTTADNDDWNQSFRFEDFHQLCPNCQRPIRPEMDSCPWCGDILYRTLKDASFMPKRGPLSKIVAIIILILITLGILAFIVQVVF